MKLRLALHRPPLPLLVLASPWRPNVTVDCSGRGRIKLEAGPAQEGSRPEFQKATPFFQLGLDEALAVAFIGCPGPHVHVTGRLRAPPACVFQALLPLVAILRFAVIPTSSASR